jgi:hypothetical protein
LSRVKGTIDKFKQKFLFGIFITTVLKSYLKIAVTNFENLKKVNVWALMFIVSKS